MTIVGQAALTTVDMVISRGADNPYRFRYQTSDGATPPTLTSVNLTGWSAHLQIRDRIGGTIWIDLASPVGIALDAQGYISFSVTPGLTLESVWDDRRIGRWDLELTDTAGKVLRFVSGSVTVSQDVTR